jgi:hypothetical protein
MKKPKKFEVSSMIRGFKVASLSVLSFALPWVAMSETAQAQTVRILVPASKEKSPLPFVAWECVGAYTKAKATLMRTGAAIFDSGYVGIGRTGTRCFGGGQLQQPITDTITPKPCDHQPGHICQGVPRWKGLHVDTPYELLLSLSGGTGGEADIQERHSFTIVPQFDDDFTSSHSRWITSGPTWEFKNGYYRGHGAAFAGRGFFQLGERIETGLLTRYEADIFFNCTNASASCSAGLLTGSTQPPRPDFWIETVVDGSRRITARLMRKDQGGDTTVQTFVTADVTQLLAGRNTFHLTVEHSDRSHGSAMRVVLEGQTLFCSDNSQANFPSGPPGVVLQASNQSDYIDLHHFRVTTSQNADYSYFCGYNAEQN